MVLWRDATRFFLRRGLRLDSTFQLQLDIHGVLDLQQPVAGILQSPLDERHAELRAPRPMIARESRSRRHGEFVFAAVQNEKPMDLDCRFAL